MRHYRWVLYCLLGIVCVLAGCGGEDSNSSSTEGSGSYAEADTSPVGLIEAIDTVELDSVEIDPASAEPVALSLPDEGLTVTVADPAIFDAAESLTVSEVATRLPAPAECYDTLAVFDISADTQTQFAGELTVTVALDRLGLAPDADLNDLYVGWWNEAMQGWIAVPVEIDATVRTATFATRHLTVFGWFMEKSGYERKQMGQFEMIWDAAIFTAPADKSDANAWTGKIIYTTAGDAAKLYPGEAWATDTNIPPFVRDAAAYLNYSRKAYKDTGFKVPAGPTSVVIETTLTEGDARNKALEIIHIGGYNSGAGQLKTAVAHELFHAVQNEYLWDLGGMMFLNWWCESTAEYASHLVWDRAHPAKSVPPKYFSERLDATGNEHEYQSAHFIDELVGPGSRDERFKTFYALWMGVQANHGLTDATDVIYPISMYLQSAGQGSVSSAFEDHVYRLCLMPGTPMVGKVAGDRPVAEMVEAWGMLGADEQEAKPLTMTLKGGHRAKVWAVKAATTKDSSQARLVELELDGESAYITATVHVLRGDTLSDKAATPQGKFTKEQRKVAVSLAPEDTAYVVVINHGSPTQSFTLDIREGEATLLDLLHQMNTVLFSFDDQVLDKKVFSCENVTWSGTSFQGARSYSGKEGTNKDVNYTDRVSGSVSADGKVLTSLSFYQHQDITAQTPTGPYKVDVTFDVGVAGIPVDPWLLTQVLTLDRVQVLYEFRGTIPFTQASMTRTDSDGTFTFPLTPTVDGGEVKVFFGKRAP